MLRNTVGERLESKVVKSIAMGGGVGLLVLTSDPYALSGQFLHIVNNVSG